MSSSVAQWSGTSSGLRRLLSGFSGTLNRLSKRDWQTAGPLRPLRSRPDRNSVFLYLSVLRSATNFSNALKFTSHRQSTVQAVKLLNGNHA